MFNTRTINENVDGTDISLEARNHAGGALISYQGFSSKPIILCQAY